jgi:hypothetical protein
MCSRGMFIADEKLESDCPLQFPDVCVNRSLLIVEASLPGGRPDVSVGLGLVFPGIG